MRHKICIFISLFYSLLTMSTACAQTNVPSSTSTSKEIIMGAERFSAYVDDLKDKRVGLIINQTSMVQNEHLLDFLLRQSIDVKAVFAPEHGFRGTADAGAHVKSGIDPSTGVPIISLYGSNKKPTAEQIKNLDVLVFDIQDVGARFYTYISTLHYVMEAAAENDKPVIVLDRPNPNGHYVDGPILEKAYTSFVGMHPIPVVHGMTIGEYARMINGQKWLNGGLQCRLKVIEMEHYDHLTPYAPPVKPSPNLPNLRSIYLYPSLCFFEGTPLSVGRGTGHPFQLWGHPDVAVKDTSFTPQSMPGATNPPLLGKLSYGKAYTTQSLEELREMKFSLQPILEAYKSYKGTAPFFNKDLFFNKLAGTDQLRAQIAAGLTEEEIRISWQEELNAFKQMRKQYLLYPDFE